MTGLERCEQTLQWLVTSVPQPYRLTMSASIPASHVPLSTDLCGLTKAIDQCQASDALRCQFTAANWMILATYLQPFELKSGQWLITQGGHDRTLYVVESGSLSVHSEDERSRVESATVGPGSVVGEGAFFSGQARHASVQAATTCKLWCLTPIRFHELASRHSAIALELTLALAAVMSRRLYSSIRRVAVT